MTSGKRHSQRLQETTPVNVSAIAGIDLKKLAGSNVIIAADSMRNVVLKRKGANMENIKRELKKEIISHCEKCGSPVVIKGKITKYYVPVNVELLKELGFKNENWFNENRE